MTDESKNAPKISDIDDIPTDVDPLLPPEHHSGQAAAAEDTNGPQTTDSSLRFTAQQDHLFQRKKAYAKRVLEVLNYIILPLQYITKDIFMLFSSYNAALNISLPALRFLGKSLSWMYGLSFMLEGICVLIEATRSENEDKRLFLIGQGLFLFLGGLSVAVFAVTNPQIYFPLICVIWGASTVLFLFDRIRDYLKNKEIMHSEKQALMDLQSQISSDQKFYGIYASNNDDFIRYLSETLHEIASKLPLSNLDTSELQAEIVEKVARLQDEQTVASSHDVDQIIADMLDNEKYNPKISKSTLLSALYLTLSFVCATLIFVFLGNSNVQQTAIFSHILITTGMLLKRSYDFVTNPIIYRAQFENISSCDMDQLSDSELEKKYLKRRLKRLGKAVVRLLDAASDAPVNRDQLAQYLTEYAKIVKEINPNDTQSLGIVEILSNCSGEHCPDHHVHDLAQALLQSIRTRQVYLGSNHACLLSRAVYTLIADAKNSANTILDTTTDNSLGTQTPPTSSTRLNETERQKNTYTMSSIAELCGELIPGKQASRITSLAETRSPQSPDTTARKSPSNLENTPYGPPSKEDDKLKNQRGGSFKK